MCTFRIILRWIFIPLVFYCLSDVASDRENSEEYGSTTNLYSSLSEQETGMKPQIVDSQTSPNKNKNGDHNKKDRQRLLRAFVLDDFSPFLEDIDEDNVKRSQSGNVPQQLNTKTTYHRRRPEGISKPNRHSDDTNDRGAKTWPTYSKIHSSVNIEPSSHNDLESSNTQKNVKGKFHEDNVRQDASDMSKRDNRGNGLVQGDTETVKKQEMAKEVEPIDELNYMPEEEENDDSNQNGYYPTQYNKGWGDTKADDIDLVETGKLGNVIDMGNNYKIKGFTGGEMNVIFGDMGHIAESDNISEKTEKNYQKRKFGDLRNNQTGYVVPKRKKKSDEVSSRKGDTGSIDINDREGEINLNRVSNLPVKSLGSRPINATMVARKDTPVPFEKDAPRTKLRDERNNLTGLLSNMNGAKQNSTKYRKVEFHITNSTQKDAGINGISVKTNSTNSVNERFQRILLNRKTADNQTLKSKIDLYVLKVSPRKILARSHNNIKNQNSRKGAKSREKNRDNLKKYPFNEFQQNAGKEQNNLLKKLLDIPVKSVVDFFRPYLLGKATPGGMKLRDVGKRLHVSLFSEKRHGKNGSNIRHSNQTARNISDVLIERNFKDHSTSRNICRTKLLTETNKLENEKGKFPKYNCRTSQERRHSASHVIPKTRKGIPSPTKHLSDGERNKSHVDRHSNKTISSKMNSFSKVSKISKKSTKYIKVKKKSDANGILRSSLNHDLENSAFKNFTEEDINVFLNSKMLNNEENTLTRNSKKSFTPRGNDIMLEENERDQYRPRSDVWGKSSKTVSGNTPYFIPLPKASSENVKDEAGVKEISEDSNKNGNSEISYDYEYSNNSMDTTRTSNKLNYEGKTSLRSIIGNSKPSYVFPKSALPNTGIDWTYNDDVSNHENFGTPSNDKQQTTGLENNRYEGMLRQGSSSSSFSRETELQRSDYSPYISSSNVPGTDAQYRFRIYHGAQKSKENVQDWTNPHQKTVGENWKTYTGIFGNKDEDLEKSCMNFGKQDFVDFCPSGWNGYKQFCFLVSQGTSRWSDVPNVCARWGGKMAMPKSQDVLAFLINKLSSDSQYSAPYFVGLRKRDEEWEWIDDTPLSQGLASGNDGDFHSCAVIQQGSLRKMSCDMSGGYICELKMGVEAMRVLAVGDSLTKGYFNGGKNYHPYGEKLQEFLNRDDHRCFVVETSGKNGEKSSDMIKRVTYYLNTRQRTFNWVIILAGTNDLLLTSDSGDKIADQVIIMHEVVHARGGRSIVVTVPEIFCERTTCPEIQEKRTLINKRLRAYADAAGNKAYLSDIALGLSLHRLPLEERKIFWEPSGVHMKATGYDKMANIIFKDLMESIESSS